MPTIAKRAISNLALQQAQPLDDSAINKILKPYTDRQYSYRNESQKPVRPVSLQPNTQIGRALGLDGIQNRSGLPQPPSTNTPFQSDQGGGPLERTSLDSLTVINR